MTVSNPARPPMAEGKGHTELLPCPFCGSEGRHEPEGRSPGYWIQCQQCRAQSDDRGSPEMAAKAWNTRAAVNTYPAVEGLVKALEGARQFITNGIELGYIRMPDSDTPDPAHQRLPQIEAALSRFRSHQNGGGE